MSPVVLERPIKGLLPFDFLLGRANISPEPLTRRTAVSELIDKPDYEKLCAEKQRRIDALEGQLEQKHGFLRRGLAKVGRALKSKMAIAFLCGLVPLTAISTGVYLKIFKPVRDAAQKPIATITDLIPYDGYRVIGLDENPDVLELENPKTGDSHFFHIGPETVAYIKSNYDKYKFDEEFILVEGSFNVVGLHDSWERYRDDKEYRSRQLEKIRKEAAVGVPAESFETK